MHDMQSLLDEISQAMRDQADRGRVADYIPQLAKVDDDKFAMAVATVDGREFASGDAAEPFSIQSISKVFALTMALGKIGDALWRRVGREPSGSAFNSIVQLEYEKGIPRNPFINAGAIVVDDVILGGHQPQETIDDILRFLRSLAADDAIFVDANVARSETETGFRNVALANYMRAFGNLDHPVAQTLDVYFQQCAIAMTASQLARAGLFLANHGTNPLDGMAVTPPQRARRVNALMLTCGHYDGSGEFAYCVGLPGKSGVAGGILAIAPGKAAVTVWSPGLNANGNSTLGTLALEMLAGRTGWSIFG